MNGRFELDENFSKALAIGMKLLGEIVLKNRGREPFSALSEFNRTVKAQGAATTTD